jgi:phycobilisome core component
MQDAITGLIGRYDQQGRYFDRSALDRLEAYFAESSLRLAAVAIINADAAEIIREASQRLWLADPELLLPGGNAYTTRRLSACLRDLDYFLRYGSYALGPTARGILLMADVLSEKLAATGFSDPTLARAPFEHMAKNLAETNLNGR